MEIILTDKQMKEIAKQVARYIKAQASTPEYVTTSEAAAILGITPAHMRRIANQYPHTKLGDAKQGRLLFDKNQLI